MRLFKKCKKSRWAVSLFIAFALLYAGAFMGLAEAGDYHPQKLLQSKTPITTGKIVKQKFHEEFIYFSGQVVTNQGKPVEEAEIEISGHTEETDKYGFFKIETKRADRYLMNIRKTGFRMISRVYVSAIENGVWEMTPGSTQLFDPSVNTMLRDIRAADTCGGPIRSRVDWSRYPIQHKSLYVNSNGDVSWDVPDHVLRTLDFFENSTSCNPGIMINLPANSLVDQNGNPPREKILASISTVDVYDPGAMPGDGTALLNGEFGYMITFGAGGITFTSKGGKYKYQLKKGAKAEITIPINESQLKYRSKPEPQIPLLLYNEEKGIWDQVGVAKLNKKKNAYVGSVYHFSEYNMDLVKTDQACVSIDSSGIDRDYMLEVIVPTVNGDIYRTLPIDNTPEKLHVIYNLPSYTDITLQAYETATGIEIPISNPIGVNTGNPQVPSTPNLPDYPYTACDREVLLTEALDAPLLSGPEFSSGSFTLSWDFSWPGPFSSSQDGFELEESTSSSTSGFSLIYSTANQSMGDNRSHVDYSLSRSPGQYWYRVRAMTMSSYTPYSNVVHVVVGTQGTRQLRITNQVGIQRLEQVVQVKIVPVGGTFGSDDLLTPDTFTCWNLPGESINPGESRTFEVSIGDDYWVFIGMGIWETDLVTGLCSINYPWIKTRFFTDLDFNIHYVWVEAHVSQHTGGIYDWTITGSYLDGNLSLNPTGSPSIPFNITTWNPIP